MNKNNQPKKNHRTTAASRLQSSTAVYALCYVRTSIIVEGLLRALPDLGSSRTRTVYTVERDVFTDQRRFEIDLGRSRRADNGRD